MLTTKEKLNHEDVMLTWNMLCADYASENRNAYDRRYPDWIKFIYEYANSMEEGLFERYMQEERE